MYIHIFLTEDCKRVTLSLIPIKPGKPVKAEGGQTHRRFTEGRRGGSS